MKPKLPEEGKVVVVEFEDAWMRKNELLFAMRFKNKWLEVRSQRFLMENKNCRVLRWWSLEPKKSNQCCPTQRIPDAGDSAPFYGLLPTP